MRNVTPDNAGRTRRILLAYYVATGAFLLLDYLLGINVRIAFLEQHAALRLGYYLFCFACLALILWRPGWTVLVSAFESLVTVVALILNFWMRVFLMSDPDNALAQPPLSVEEIVNFVISGSMAYTAWWRGVRALQF